MTSYMPFSRTGVLCCTLMLAFVSYSPAQAMYTALRCVTRCAALSRSPYIFGTQAPAADNHEASASVNAELPSGASASMSARSTQGNAEHPSDYEILARLEADPTLDVYSRYAVLLTREGMRRYDELIRRVPTMSLEELTMLSALLQSMRYTLLR